MIVNQNTITLQVQNGFYEEYVLDPAEAGNVMPGAIVSIKSTPDMQADHVNAAVVSSQSAQAEIDDVELLVLVENALLGKSINHKANKGEVIPLCRPISGDRLLVRCVSGDYKDGDALGYKQTANGIYLAKMDDADGSEIKAYAMEAFAVPVTSQPANTPPFYYDVVDDSTTERPASTVMNTGVVNLLRVRIA